MSAVQIPVWKENPFLRILPPFTAGVCAGSYYPVPPTTCLSIIFLLLFLVIILSFAAIKKRFKWRLLAGATLFALLFISGMLVCFCRNTKNRPSCLKKGYQDDSVLLLKLEDDPSARPNTLCAIASIVAIWQNDKSTGTASGFITIYLARDSCSTRLRYGDELITHKKLREISNSGNPGDFDYKRYCELNSIYYQLYLQSNEYRVLDKRHPAPFRKILLSIRREILEILRNYIRSDRECGLAEALLLGYKGDLDKDLLQSYAVSGVVHVIAISGLHLGLIYWILQLLTRPMERKRVLKPLQPAIIIAALWMFALLTGASPSVLRSALMFSCLILGKLVNRSSSAFNSLAASAFLLLSYNPAWCWDAGFQLSYAALLSILIFQNPIYQLFFFASSLANKTWQLCAVTLSAQVLTIPLVIFHFNQFPNLFLLTNLLAVPLSSLVLLGEILLCCLAFLPIAASLLGRLLEWLIRGMNFAMEKAAALPFSTTSSLNLTNAQLILVYLFITALAFWLMHRKKSALPAALFLLFIVLGLRARDYFTHSRQQKIVVYNLPGYSVIDFVNGLNLYEYDANHKIPGSTLRQRFLQPGRMALRARSRKNVPGLLIGNHLIYFGSIKILLIDSTFFWRPTAEKWKVDWVLVSNGPLPGKQGLPEWICCSLLVLDSSNPSWKVDKWKKYCRQAGLPCYSVVDKGAFVMNLR